MTDTALTSTRQIAGREVPVAGSWSLDPTHTTITFEARHMMISKVRGTFGTVTGSIEVGEDPMESQVTALIDVSSVETGSEDRNNHLLSPDFFDVESHPNLAFRSTGVEATSNGYSMTGELTVKEVTKPVTVDFEFNGGLIDPFGNARVAFSAEFEVDREDWDLTWNMALETGGVMVGKKIKVTLDTEAVLDA